jgi:carbon monoxide dehydrogenase subunit G
MVAPLGRASMLGNILLGGAGVLVAFVAFVATRGAAYHVERKLAVDAPPEVVFGVLNDLRRFAGVLVLFGSPWEESDPKMQKTIEGPASGVGQSYAWTGKEAGKGKMTIEESVPGQKVVIKLEFVKPMASLATLVFTLAGTPTGTLVTWSMAGDHNFIGKAFRVFINMDNMLAADLEKGLVRLKTAAESKKQATPAA